MNNATRPHFGIALESLNNQQLLEVSKWCEKRINEIAYMSDSELPKTRLGKYQQRRVMREAQQDQIDKIEMILVRRFAQGGGYADC